MESTPVTLLLIGTASLVAFVICFLKKRSRPSNTIASRNSKFLMRMEDPDLTISQIIDCKDDVQTNRRGT